jgi:hypothetical protein
MSNLKKWVLVPIACVFGFSALVVVLAVLSVKVGFLWALLILSVLAAVIAFALASKFKKHARNIGGGMTLALMCIWGITGIANVGAWMIGSSNAPATVQTHGDVDAYVEATMRVQQLLKAPSTAKFAPMGETQIEHFANGDGYKITGYVDSQNSFGAMLRTDWSISFLYVGDRKQNVDVQQIVIGGEEMYRKPGLK